MYSYVAHLRLSIHVGVDGFHLLEEAIHRPAAVRLLCRQAVQGRLDINEPVEQSVQLHVTDAREPTGERSRGVTKTNKNKIGEESGADITKDDEGGGDSMSCMAAVV